MDIAILAPIPVEYRAVKAYLEDAREEAQDGQYYTVGAFRGRHHTFSVVLRETGSRNNEVALAAERIIRHYRPAIIILAGIAGGVKDARIGDVVVATQAYGYEAGKATDEGFSSRPNVLPYSPELVERARSIERAGRWRNRLSPAVASPQVFFGPIASGDQVVASSRSETYRIIKAHYNDTLALEMESIGFAKAVLAYPHIRAMNIRGISDLLDGKNTEHDAENQPRAAAHAAAFVFELLDQLDFSNLKIYHMDAKTLVQKAFSIIIPFVKMESVQEIGKELKTATDNTIRDIWKKLRPLFIEEIKDLSEEPEDEETQEMVQGAIKTKLTRAFKNNEALREEIAALIKQAEEKGAASAGNVNINNSKNVVLGSRINVGGDFRVGDG